MFGGMSTWAILCIVAMGLCAWFFYLYGEHERSSGWVWGGISAVVSLVTMFLVGSSMLWLLGAQMGLFAVATVVNMASNKEARIVK